jgi:hypothetical protein
MNGWTRAGRIIERIAENVVRVEFQREPSPPTPRFPGAGALPPPSLSRLAADGMGAAIQSSLTSVTLAGRPAAAHIPR